MMIESAAWAWLVESRARLIGNLVLVVVCMIVGGLMGLSKLKSSTLGPEAQT
jgi:hypothetical protein